MLLCVDIGNTHTVFGVFDGSRLAACWRFATRRDATEDEWDVLLEGLFRLDGLDPSAVSGTALCSVVPDLDPMVHRLLERRFGRLGLVVGPGVKTGMRILYESPRDVGADRIANAVAAVDRYGAPVVVLDFGTATTFDVVNAAGDYLGGVIAPGVGVAAEALFRRAARLVRVDVARPSHVIGRHTRESVQSGLFHGYTALVEGVVRKIRDELGAEAPVVATGGLASTFADELAFLTGVDPHLTLHGLRLLWERNHR